MINFISAKPGKISEFMVYRGILQKFAVSGNERTEGETFGKIGERFERTKWPDLRRGRDTVVSFRASRTSLHRHFQSA